MKRWEWAVVAVVYGLIFAGMPWLAWGIKG